MIWIAATLILALLAYVLNQLMIEFGPKGPRFPVCMSDGALMVKVDTTSLNMPKAIQDYLQKWNLSDVVIQRYVCRKCGRELWVAPQVGDMEKSLYVGRKA